MAELNLKPDTFDLVIEQGDTISLTGTLTDDNSDPVDITGATFACEIRKNPGDIRPRATADTEIVTAASGIFSFTFSAESTAGLFAGDDEDDPDSLYYWDLDMTSSGGAVTTLFQGTLRVFREITKVS